MVASGIDLAALGRLDTPTVCNALASVAPEAAARAHTKAPLACARPGLPPVVGFARTVLFRTLEPSTLDAETRTAREHAYLDYVAGGPTPSVLVIQDVDSPVAGTAAVFGEVQSFAHQALGCSGLVTNGAVRDVGLMAEGFQALFGAVAPSRGHYHRVDFDCEVNVAGMYVRTGDIVHADANGAIVIPTDSVPAVLEAASEIQRKEAALIALCRDPAFSLERLKTLWAVR